MTLELEKAFNLYWVWLVRGDKRVMLHAFGNRKKADEYIDEVADVCAITARVV